MAVQPRLLNPTKIEFAQKNEAQTRYDNLRRSPVNVVVTDTKFTIDGQIKWVMEVPASTPEATQVGVDDRVLGYIIVRTKDLEALGKALKRGDRITKLENREALYYVLRVEYGSHYGGDFKLQKVVFSDRKGQDG